MFCVIFVVILSFTACKALTNTNPKKGVKGGASFGNVMDIHVVAMVQQLPAPFYVVEY